MSSLGRFAVLVAALLIVIGRAAAVAPEIRDGGKFFGEEAVKKGNETIREIYKKYGKDVLIETFATVPPADIDKFKDMTNDEKKAYFRKWAIQRHDLAVVQGVYILVCKQPTKLEVLISPKTKATFDSKAYRHLMELLINNFKEKRQEAFDKGLMAAVTFIKETFEKAKSEKKD